MESGRSIVTVNKAIARSVVAFAARHVICGCRMFGWHRSARYMEGGCECIHCTLESSHHTFCVVFGLHSSVHEDVGVERMFTHTLGSLSVCEAGHWALKKSAFRGNKSGFRSKLRRVSSDASVMELLWI